MPEYTLYSYFRSSCSARLRIALNLKDIPYDLIPVNLVQGEHRADAHRALNPSGTVPLLVCHSATEASSSDPFKITQSVAALEYLDETHPTATPLLPSSDPRARASVRALAMIVACDIQPITNLSVTKRIRSLGHGDQEVNEWMRTLMAEGLEAYEKIAAPLAGTYSVGDNVSIADCCLVPGVWNAQRWGVDMAPYPTILRIMSAMEKLPAVKKAGYYVQPDTPEALRDV